MAKKEKIVQSSSSLQDLMDKINVAVGEATIQVCDPKLVADIPVFPTGILALDKVFGVGGIPRGRVVEIYGPESSGKTTLCLNIMAAIQKAGGTVAIIDAEHALDKTWAGHIGLDMSVVPICQPNSGEEAWKVIEMLVVSRRIDCIVVDSVAALTPQVEIDGEITQANIGAQARMMSKGMRKIVALANQCKCTIIFINQLREKIGVMFGNPETTPGGRALKFYASIRIDIRKDKTIKDGDRNIGNTVRVKIVKNKVAPPFETTELVIKYGVDGTYGIDKIDSLIETAFKLEILERPPGNWYHFKGEKLAAGKQATAAYLKANQNIYDDIYKAVTDKLKAEKISRPVSSDVSVDEDMPDDEIDNMVASVGDESQGSEE